MEVVMKQWMINAATILFDDTKNDPINQSC